MGDKFLTLPELIEATGVTEKRLRYLLRRELIPKEVILQRTGTGKKILFAHEAVSFLKATEKAKTNEVQPGKAKEVLPGKSNEVQPGKSKEVLPGKSKEVQPGRQSIAQPAAAEIIRKLELIEARQEALILKVEHIQKLVFVLRAAVGDAEIMIKLIDLLPADALNQLFKVGE